MKFEIDHKHLRWNDRKKEWENGFFHWHSFALGVCCGFTLFGVLTWGLL